VTIPGCVLLIVVVLLVDSGIVYLVWRAVQ